NIKGELPAADEGRPIPPGHRHGMPVFLVAQVIAVIGAKHTMMNEGMPLEGINKHLLAPVHHPAVKCPFEQAAKGGTHGQARGHYPEKMIKVEHAIYPNN